jgi:hypothetical protein
LPAKEVAPLFRTAVPLLLLAATPAAADEQAWVSLIAQGPVSGKLITWLEVQPRFSLNPAQPRALLLRPALGAQINDRTTFLFGYLNQENFPENRPSVREHRIWQQIQTRLAGTPGKAVLVSRTRMEERFVEGSEDHGLRLRQMLRGQLWSPDGKLSLVGTSEAFFGLNSTRWGQLAGVDQWRNFIGVGVPVSKHFTIEAGYLNQWLIRPTADISNNIISVSLFYRIG